MVTRLSREPFGRFHHFNPHVFEERCFLKRRAVLYLAILVGFATLLANHDASAKSKPAKAGAARKTAPAASGAKKTPTIAPEARVAIAQMGQYLQELDTWALHAETTAEGVITSGSALPSRCRVEIAARKPDRLRVDMRGEIQDQAFFYDGQAISLHDRRQSLYALVAAPSRLDGALDMALNAYGLELPLVRMIHDATRQNLLKSVMEGGVSGTVEIAGVPCQQLTFRQEDVDWQIWIETGTRPLPRKLSITTKNDKTRPRFSAVIDWDVKPPLDDAHFAFEAPPDTPRIAFVRADSRLTDKKIVRRELVRRDLDALSETFFSHYPVADMARAGLGEGTVVASIPSGCGAQHIGGVAYQYCGRSWYMPQFVGTKVTYVVVDPPL
jgi:hypothetical protein